MRPSGFVFIIVLTAAFFLVWFIRGGLFHQILNHILINGIHISVETVVRRLCRACDLLISASRTSLSGGETVDV